MLRQGATSGLFLSIRRPRPMSGTAILPRPERNRCSFHFFFPSSFYMKTEKCGSARAAVCAAEWRTGASLSADLKSRRMHPPPETPCAVLLIRVGPALQCRLLDWQNPFKSHRYFLVAVTHASLSDDHLAAASIDSNSSGYSFSSRQIT